MTTRRVRAVPCVVGERWKFIIRTIRACCSIKSWNTIRRDYVFERSIVGASNQALLIASCSDSRESSVNPSCVHRVIFFAGEKKSGGERYSNIPRRNLRAQVLVGSIGWIYDPDRSITDFAVTSQRPYHVPSTIGPRSSAWILILDGPRDTKTRISRHRDKIKGCYLPRWYPRATWDLKRPARGNGGVDKSRRQETSRETIARDDPPSNCVGIGIRAHNFSRTTKWGWGSERNLGKKPDSNLKRRRNYYDIIIIK